MFLKRSKIFRWLCCLLAALCFSVSIAVYENTSNDTYNSKTDNEPTTTVATTTVTKRQTSHLEESSSEVSTYPAESVVRDSFATEPDKHYNFAFRYVSPVLFIIGIFLAIGFVFFAPQVHPHLGPEAELLMLFLTVFIAPLVNEMFLYIKIVLHFILLILILMSLRGLFSWLWRKLPLHWTDAHQLGTFLSNKRQSRYLTFQIIWCLITFACCIIFIFLSLDNQIMLILSSICLLATILSVCCCVTLAKDVEHLTEQISQLHQEREVTVRSGVFKSTEEQLIDLHRQRDEAVQSAITSERFKVELISNVSHDLRTPLTSILGYGELLEQESLSPEGKAQLNHLNQKAGYMHDLVESLFELTKVSSGAAEIHMEEIDLIRLLEQTLGLFDDRLNAANLQVRRHYDTDSLMLITDGARMYQVFANLVGNAIKYALSGTRIHLEVKDDVEKCTVRITNIASYEMDFQPYQILQRFARGDKARSTNGSGLGLAIAQTYTESVNGHFSIAIDGEQFSAIVTLPKS